MEKKIVKKIDMHAHTVRTLGIPRPNGTNFILPEALIGIYDRLGVEKGVLLPLVSPEGSWTYNTNEDIVEIAKRYSERFDFYCSIDPRVGENAARNDFGSFLRYYMNEGARGVGEVTANVYFDDPRVLALFEVCEEYGLPVTFHIGAVNGDYGLIDDFGLPRLEKVLRMFPKLRFLGHSQRFWSHISGDVDEVTMHDWPTGTVTKGGRVVELMRKYPNLCGDLSASSGYGAICRDPAFGYAFLEEFCDRLYFALDLCSPEDLGNPMRFGLVKFLDDAMLEGHISYDAYVKISRGNALKLLGR